MEEILKIIKSVINNDFHFNMRLKWCWHSILIVHFGNLLWLFNRFCLTAIQFYF